MTEFVKQVHEHVERFTDSASPSNEKHHGAHDRRRRGKSCGGDPRKQIPPVLERRQDYLHSMQEWSFFHSKVLEMVPFGVEMTRQILGTVDLGEVAIGKRNPRFFSVVITG